MNPRLFEAALRRERLIERIGTQRERLAGHSGGLRRICAGGDRAIAAGQHLRENPEWIVVALVTLVVVRPRRAWRLAKTGFVLWRGWEAIRRRLAKLKSR